MTSREKLARVIAIESYNLYHTDSTARLPILQEGKYAKSPYFEVYSRSGVSLKTPDFFDYELSDRILERWPEIEKIVEREDEQ